tara:strand:- start:140 stop:1246 length:1107 start_codon:yes stop_codon:yes gene_type:complete
LTDAYQIVKKNLIDKKYLFLNIEYLKKEYQKEKNNLDFKFDKYIIIGIGGSSQGSKAIAGILNKKNIFYFDHLNSKEIKRTLDLIDPNNTGFIFISKSGTTSEVLTLFDHLVEKLKNKTDISKNFLVITEKNTAPLYTLAEHAGIKIIKHESDIGGRFSIFSHTGLIPISLFHDDVESIFEGCNQALDNFMNDKYPIDIISPKEQAIKKFELIKDGKNINIMLVYGDELYELGNWLKQLFAESLGKKNFGFLPVVSKMTQDQHNLLQLYLDGPKDKFFEIHAVDYNESSDFIDITLINHKDAMIKTLDSEKLPIIKISNYAVENVREISLQIGNLFANSILEVLMLAELGNVDPFGQDAVEKQKNFLK